MIRITNQNEYRPTLTKLLFILRKFGGNFDLKHALPDLWREVKEMERVRHHIVHPKSGEEELYMDVKKAEKCIDVVVEIVSLLKERIYGR